MALDGETSTMKLDHRLREGQSEPGTLMLAVVSRARAVKGLDHQRNFLRSHPDTGVADPNSQPDIVCITEYHNVPPRGGKLNCIAQNINKYLFELDRIAVQYRPTRWRPVHVDLDLGRFRRSAKHHEALIKQD